MLLSLGGCATELPAPRTAQEQTRARSAENALRGFEAAMIENDYAAAAAYFEPKGQAVDNSLWHATGPTKVASLYTEIGSQLDFRDAGGVTPRIDGARVVLDGQYHRIWGSRPNADFRPRAAAAWSPAINAKFEAVLAETAPGDWRIESFETFLPQSGTSAIPSPDQIIRSIDGGRPTPRSTD